MTKVSVTLLLAVPDFSSSQKPLAQNRPLRHELLAVSATGGARTPSYLLSHAQSGAERHEQMTVIVTLVVQLTKEKDKSLCLWHKLLSLAFGYIIDATDFSQILHYRAKRNYCFAIAK